MSQATSDLVEGVPFSFLCSLFREISQITPQTAASRSRERNSNPNYLALDVFKRWTAQLHNLFSPLPPGTTAIVFRFLFPEEDSRRKYDMQELTLARHLAECIGVDPKHFQRCFSESASGSLGEELRLVLERTCPTTEGHISTLSISQVDDLLDELASNSGFSHQSIRNVYPKRVRRGRLSLLKALFRPLSPMDASFLTQIILKDLRPVLYPLHVHHYSSALLDFNTTSVHMLTKEHAMKVWDPSCWMLKAYRVRSTIDEAAASFELPPHQREPNIPRVGIPVQIPKSEKGRSCTHALEFLRNSKKVWAETKYDGERAQIHVEILPGSKSRITIFSKSKRDSTFDRHATHEIIRKALGLSRSPSLDEAKIKRNIILDAEMVACDGTKIDEFWRIRDLIEQTAHGIRRKKSHRKPSQIPDSQSSTETDISEHRHLALVFFDILLLDEKCLLSSPYSQRRALLESTILVSPGESMIARRVPISMEPNNNSDRALDEVFSAIIADYEEGLVIKAEESRYHDYKMPWIKLKKDYIPGYGDTVDLVVVGAIWDKTRGRELRVPPSTLTTLYIGALSNAKDIEKDPNCRPHFQVYFTVSYGLTRNQLEEINFLIKNSDPTPYSKSTDMHLLPYNFNLLRGLQPPSWVLKTPLLAELFGAGFTKAPHSEDYELRFPRLTKIHRPVERSWKDAVNLQSLHKIACDSVGLANSDKDIRDWSSGLWGRPVSPGVKSTLKRKTTSGLLEHKLSLFPGSKRLKLDPSPSALGNRENTDKSSPRMSPVKPLASKTNISDYSPSCHPNVSDVPNIAAWTTDSRTSTPIVQNMAPPTLTFPPYPSPTKTQLVDISSISAQRALDEESSGRLFLASALVWVAKPREGGGSSHSSHRSRVRTLPHGQRIHSLESLLAGCGWSKGVLGSSWVERGVMFVDVSTVEGNKWKDYALEVVEQRRRSLPSEQARKPIWIFDLKTWSLSMEGHHRTALYLLE